MSLGCTLLLASNNNPLLFFSVKIDNSISVNILFSKFSINLFFKEFLFI